jgi:hypothetical protein
MSQQTHFTNFSWFAYCVFKLSQNRHKAKITNHNHFYNILQLNLLGL